MVTKKKNGVRAPDLDKYIKEEQKCRYVTYYEGAQMYNMAYSLFVKTAKLAGANYPIRKTAIVDLALFDKYLEEQAVDEEPETVGREETKEMMRQEVEHLQELVESGAKKYIRIDEATKLYSVGLSTVRKIAKEAGAFYKVGGTVLIKVSIFEDYIENKGKEDTKEKKKGKR